MNKPPTRPSLPLKPSLKLTKTGRFGLLLLGVILLAAGPAAAGAQDQETIPSFKRIVIDEDPPKQPYYKMVGDVTGDGRLDIVVAGRTGPIVMYSRPDWKKTLLAEGGYDGGVRGSLADINGNGRLDMVMGGIVWFENPGAAGGEWTVHSIDRQRVHDVLVADLTGNGRSDVVGRDQSAFGRAGNALYIYYQQEPNVWKKEVLDCPHGEGLAIADIDRDGRPDIVINGRWFRNQPGKWTPHVFAPEWTHPDTKVEVGDINGNGRPDVVLTPAELRDQRYRISWFEAPAGDKTRPWKEHVIVPEVECVIHSLALRDFNNDGALDVAYAEMHQGQDPDEVVVLFNFDNGARWEKLVIDQHGSHDIIAADLTGNGAIDIVGANHAGVHPVVIWQNQLLSNPSASASPAPLDRWTYIQIEDSRASRKFGLAMGDLNGNGLADIASGQYVYFNPGGDMTAPWTRRELPSPDLDALLILNVNDNHRADLDRDGHNDVIATLTDRSVAWWRNPGTNAEHWSHFEIGSLPGPIADRIKVGDLNGNSRLDVVVSAANGKADGLYLFEQPAAGPAAGPWPRRTLARTGSMNSMDLADLTGNGHLDIIAGEHRGDLILAVWENDGTGAFTRRVVDQGKESHLGARVHDLDGNGALDIVSIAWDRFPFLHLWRNDAPSSTGANR